MSEKSSSEKLAHFQDKKDIAKALDTTNSELLRLRQQLNVRPNSSDPTEAAAATKALTAIYDYVDESPECTQLFKIWEWQQQNAVAKVEVPILEVLSKLIHQCNTALHRAHSMKLTRAILQNHMTVIYRHLSSGKPNTVQATLRLLTAMNHVHQITTRELKDDFNFGLKVLSKLRNQRRKETEGDSVINKADTRTLYIQFLLAFFVRGDATVKKEVLEIPDLIQRTLNDLYLDSFQLIKQTLNILLNHIVMDNDLSRTVKISFFNTSFLVKLLQLYSRTEPVPNTDETVATLTHKFMMALCTTPGVGICFQDAAWYSPSTLSSTSSVEKATTEKHIFNKTLSQLLAHLRPTENLLQQELTVSILTACPELVRLFWQKASVQMEPRLSARWLANMTLLHKITEIPVPNLYLQHTGLFASHPPPVSTIIENILPTPANRTILSKGLQHSSMLVRYFTIVELAAAFQKTEQVIAIMQSAVRTLASDVEDVSTAGEVVEIDESATNTKHSDPPAQQWSNAISLLLAELRRRVPDIQIVISLHNGIQSQNIADKEEEERVRLNLFNNGVLRLIKYYQQFLPQAVSESKFDIGKLIPSDFSTVQAGTLIHLLELLLELNDFRWSNKSLDGTSSHLSKLLSLYLTTAHPQIKSLTQRLVSKLLGESILFQHDPSETNLWIEAIPVTNYGRPDLTSDQIAFLHFLDDCVMRCLRTPYKYVDQSSKIIKALQEPTSAMDVDSQEIMEKIASTLAASQYQNHAQQYSPLLMTILEQFQHAYAKENSQNVVRSITSFLQCLLPTLTWNQNRSPALAIECLRKIQEPTPKSIENVLALSMEKRAVLLELNGTEHLAMSLKSLNGTKTPLSSKKSPFSLKTDDSDLLSLLDEDDRSKFMEQLHNQCTASVAKNFGKLVHFSAESVGSTRCIVDYVRTRLPFMGSLYDFPEVSELLSDSVKEENLESNNLYTFLKTLPFSTLFQNVNPINVSSPRIQDLLKHAIRQTESRHLALYSALVVYQLSYWLQTNQAKKASVEACFALLAVLLESSRFEEAVFTDFKTRLWEQFTLRELYLYQPQGTKDQKATEVLGTLDERIVDLLVASTKSPASSTSKTHAADLILASHFIRKTVERVVLELEGMRMVGGSSLQAKTVRYLSKLAFMCHVSDLTMLLQSLLGLHRHPKFTTTATFNALLSTILKHLAQQSGSASAIPVESTAALLGLWREQPSDELDEIVLDVIRGRLWPNAMAEVLGPIDLTTPGVFDQALGSLQGPMLDCLDLSLVDFILEKCNRRRCLILSALLTASSEFRQRFASTLLNMSVSKRKALLEDDEFLPLLHAYLTRVSIKHEKHYTWSACSPQDRKALKALRSILLPTFVQRIAKSSYSSHETLVAAEAAAILISLDVGKDDEDDIASVWASLESIPRIGLDSIRILDAVLDITKDIQNGDKKMERQDRISRWFEITAQRLIVVLDKSGDAEWLEPVCDRLYEILEAHVIERKLSIDQKILFELVSFAIEKALDNVELVRFSAFLAKHYYVETTQSSVLPQILQTLFKHRQFSSLVMSTAPTTKHAIPENLKSRLAIVQLIYTLTSLKPETCCKAGFLPLLLSCYSASTSVADQLLLAVLRITESQTGGSISNRAPIWGTGSDNVKSSGSLFGQAMINESLDLIDAGVMMASLIHFPLDRALENPVPSVTLKDYSEEVLKKRQAPMYDPCFMLPLFGTYMAFGTQLDSRKLIEANGLGLIIVALSSHDDTMRLAAFSLLDDFYGIVSLATMREKNQVMLLLDTLKNSIVEREDNVAPRIPTVITTFVAHALSTLLRPDHFMYPHVNKFCLQRPTIDMEDIPMFYSLFNSSSEQHRKERVWMLRLLAASLKTSEDYKLFKRRHVVDLLVAFFNSQLSEPLSKKIVIEILFNASSIPKVSLQMITQSAFLSWLHTLSSMSAMSSENEFSLVPSRLLLRFVQSCPKESIKWMNGVWMNQVAGIATTLLRELSVVKVTATNLTWALTSLESILEIFSFIEASSALSSTGSFFTASHTQRFLQFLTACELVMVVTQDQCPVQIPESIAWLAAAEELSPKRSDPLDLLYRIDPIPTQSHSRIVRLGFDLVCQDRKATGSAEDKQALLARALCYRVQEAVERARQIQSDTSKP
ncbi:hypothetical protein BGZ52_004134 [Haplosporangium bisporale]|nr:hypothetical protein BGZ52_004134 [Haplosporangium bisporale]KAF9216282.1 hypothetical protein BGZ59_010333 [Podila verticillata]